MVQRELEDGWSLFPLSVISLVNNCNFYRHVIISNFTSVNSTLQRSGLPWSPPKKALNVDFGDLSDAISSALGVSRLTCAFMCVYFQSVYFCPCIEFIFSSFFSFKNMNFAFFFNIHLHQQFEQKDAEPAI